MHVSTLIIKHSKLSLASRLILPFHDFLFCVLFDTAQPLLIDCESSSSGGHVTVSCQTNRPPVTTMCSFDDGPQHKCVFLPHNASIPVITRSEYIHDAYFLFD